MADDRSPEAHRHRDFSRALSQEISLAGHQAEDAKFRLMLLQECAACFDSCPPPREAADGEVLTTFKANVYRSERAAYTIRPHETEMLWVIESVVEFLNSVDCVREAWFEDSNYPPLSYNICFTVGPDREMQI